jgi:hypothetical protein
MKKGLGDDIYAGAASFGKIRAVIGVVIGTLIGLVAVVGGIALIVHKTIFTKSVIGTVVDINNNPTTVPNCKAINMDGNGTNMCSFTLKYTVDGKVYTHPFNTNTTVNYSNLSKVTIYYDPDSPGNVSIEKDDNHVIGYISLGVGVFFILGSWLNLWLTLKYKFMAAAGGVAGAFSMIR